MAVTTVAYCTRADVKSAVDIKMSARLDGQVDRAIQAAARDTEGRLHRRFYPADATRYFDWPNYQSAYPWRIWLDQNELAAVPTQVTAGGAVISLANIFFEPVNSAPPYTRIELNRSTSATFAAAATPQRAVAITGTYGFDTLLDPVTTLAAAVSDTTGTTLTVSDSSQLSPGALVVIDTERLLVQDSVMTQAGSLAVAGTGVTSASAADNTLAVSGAGSLFVGETILIDAERMLVVDLSGSSYIVKRAWDGTVLNTHVAGDTISALRLLTVSRGALGTTAATHSSAATVNKHHVPSLIRELNVALSINNVLQETSGYSRTVGEGDTLRQYSGTALASIWDEAITRYGRKNRQRVI